MSTGCAGGDYYRAAERFLRQGIPVVNEVFFRSDMDIVKGAKQSKETGPNVSRGLFFFFFFAGQ